MLPASTRHTMAGTSAIIAFIAVIYLSTADANGVYRPPDRYINYCDSGRFGLSARCYNELICDTYCPSAYNSYATIPKCGSKNSPYQAPAKVADTRYFTLEGLYGYPNKKEYTSFRFLVEGDRYGENVAVKIYYDWNGDNKWDRVESYDAFHIYKTGKQLVWYENYPSSVIGDQSYKPFYNGRVKVVFWQFGEVQGNVRIFTDCAGRQFSSVINLPYDNDYVWKNQPGGGYDHHKRGEEDYNPGQGGAGGHHDGDDYGRGISYSSRCPIVVIPVPGNVDICRDPSRCNAHTEFAITGTVFYDQNNNGIDDQNYNFLYDVTITLYRVGNLMPVRKIELKAGNYEKNYAFVGLEAGSYYAKFESTAVSTTVPPTGGKTLVWTCKDKYSDNKNKEINDSDVYRNGISEIIELRCGADNVFKDNIGLAETDCYYSALKAGATTYTTPAGCYAPNPLL